MPVKFTKELGFTQIEKDKVVDESKNPEGSVILLLLPLKLPDPFM
jgi:hypothetical protein